MEEVALGTLGRPGSLREHVQLSLEADSGCPVAGGGCGGEPLEAPVGAAPASQRGVLFSGTLGSTDDQVTDLCALACGPPEDGAAEDDPSADSRSQGQHHKVAHPAPSAKPLLSVGREVGVVVHRDLPRTAVEVPGELSTQVEALDAAKVGTSHEASAVGVEHTGESQADPGPRCGLQDEVRQPLEERVGAVLQVGVEGPRACGEVR